MPISADPLVEARAVSKRYGPTLALDNVSLKLHAGHSVALVGRNGAGKSTLVRLLTGLHPPDSGQIYFSGAPAPGVSARGAWRSKVACVYQKSTILPDLSVGENLFLNDHPLNRLGYIDWAQARRLGLKELADWGLDIDLNQRAGDITVGQRQRLEIARALRQGSRFIILDEPTARLELREIKQLFEHVARLKAAGVTFLFISHHLAEVYEICERVAVIRDGRLVAEAPVGDLDQQALVAAMVGGDVAAMPAARPAMVAGGRIMLDVDSVSVPQAVEGATIRIHAGERVGLAGLAGSGKSELAQAIVGQLAPSGGRISVSGQAVPPGRTDIARDSGIGYVPEDRHAEGFCDNLSVEENIALPVLRRLSWMGWISGKARRALADSMIAKLQIKVSDAAQSAGELSGGNQQKTVMARALASAPDVLVLRYPTAGVDIAAKQALFGVIQDSESAVLLVSDEVDELAICNRVMVMFDGKIVREFPSGWKENELVSAIEGLEQ